MHKSFKYLIPAFMAFTLAACGGSSSSKSESADYSGKTSPASFDSLNEDQKQAVGKDSATVIYEAANISDADGMIGDFPSAAEVQSGSALQDKAKSILTEAFAKANKQKHKIQHYRSCPLQLQKFIMKSAQMAERLQ